MYSSSLGSAYSTAAMGNTLGGLAMLGIWSIIAVVLAIIGGIVLYFTFLSKRNEGKFKGFWGWTYDFLTFKKMCIEHVLKICYLIGALFITLISFGFIGVNFLLFLAILVFGNVLARVAYELALVQLIICRNTTEMNDKLKAKDNK